MRDGREDGHTVGFLETAGCLNAPPPRFNLFDRDGYLDDLRHPCLKIT